MVLRTIFLMSLRLNPTWLTKYLVCISCFFGRTFRYKLLTFTISIACLFFTELRADLILSDFILEKPREGEGELDSSIKKMSVEVDRIKEKKERGLYLLKLALLYTDRAYFAKDTRDEARYRNLAEQKCRKILQEGIREVIDDRLFYYLGLNLYLSSKRFEAATILSNIEKKYPESDFIPSVLLILGEYKFGLKNYEQAKIYFYKVLDNKGAIGIYASYMLALIQIETNDLKGGLSILNKLLLSIKEQEKEIPQEIYVSLEPYILQKIIKLKRKSGASAEFSKLEQEYIAKFNPKSPHILKMEKNRRYQKIISFSQDIILPSIHRDYRDAERINSFEGYKKVISSIDYHLTIFDGLFNDATILFLYASSLYNVEDFEKARESFKRIVDSNKSVKLKEDSLLYLVKISARALGKEAIGARSIASIKISEKSNKDGDIVQLSIPSPEMELIKSCDEFIKGVGRSNEDLPDIEFLAGKIYYKYNHFNEAVRYFSLITSSFTESKIAKLAVEYILNSLKYEKKYGELSKRINSYLKIRALASGSLKNTLLSTRDEAEIKTLEQSFSEGRYSESASGYYNLYKSKPKSRMSTIALKRAVESYIKLNNKKMVDEILMILTRLYHGQDEISETLYNISLFYFRNYYFDSAATLGEKLANGPVSDISKKALILSIRIREELSETSKLAEDLILFSEKFSSDPLAREYLIKAYKIYFTSKISGWKSEDMVDILKTEKKNIRNYLSLASLLLARFYQNGKISEARSLFDEIKRTTKNKESIEYKSMIQTVKYEEGTLLLHDILRVKNRDDFKRIQKKFPQARDLFKETSELPENEIVVDSYLSLGVILLKMADFYKRFDRNDSRSNELRNESITYFNKTMESSRRYELYTKSYFSAKEHLMKLGFFKLEEFPFTKYSEYHDDSLFTMRIYDKTDRVGELRELFDKGVQNLKQGNLSDARNLFHQCIRKDPVLSEAYLNLGFIYEMEDDFDKAGEIYDELSKVDNELIDAHISLIRIDALKNRIVNATQKLELIIKKYPKNMALQYYAIDLLTMNKKYKEAERAIYRLISKNRDNSSPFIRLATIKAGLNKFGEAKLILQTLSERDSAKISPLINLSFLYIKNGEYREALETLRRAALFRIDNSTLYENMARLYFDLANFENAIKYFELLIRLNPSYYPAYHDISLSYMALSKMDIALLKLIDAKTRFNENKLILYKIGKLYFDLKDYKNAHIHFKKYLDLTNNMPKERDGGFKTAQSASEYIEKIKELEKTR